MSEQPPYVLRIRSYPSVDWVDVWITRIEGPSCAGLLHGEMLSQQAEELAAALGLPVSRESVPADVGPLKSNPAEYSPLFAGAAP